MQISLQDVRTLGYKKIAQYYLGDNKDNLLSSITNVNNMYYSMKIPPYSLLNKWCLISGVYMKDIHGYSSFVYSLEPMIDLESPSNSAKRKCRNTWESMWNNFKQVVNLQDYELNLIKDFGLKVLFIWASMQVDNEKLNKLCGNIKLDYGNLVSIKNIIDFYNIILTWSVFTQQESNFSKNGMNYNDVLNMLVLSDKEDFKSHLKGIF